VEIVRGTIIVCYLYLKKSKIITVNRLVHYGQSQHYYGQAILGPGMVINITDKTSCGAGHNKTRPLLPPMQLTC